MNVPVSGWAQEVVTFLASNLPGSVENGGWDDMASTPYQIGCDAIVALGQAERSGRCAVPTLNPVIPDTLPRWDDIGLAVLRLAHQERSLIYCAVDSRQSKPNIGSAGTLGAAIAQPAALSVLSSLGLIDDGCWSKQADIVLWREQPHEWQMDVTRDPRFLDGVQIAVDTLPADIREEIDLLVTITESDVDTAIAVQKIAEEEWRKKHGTRSSLGQSKTPEQIRSSLISLRKRELDWIFFRRWRLSNGWLTPQQAGHALEVFDDPLARQMRCAAIKTLYPNQTEFLQ